MEDAKFESYKFQIRIPLIQTSDLQEASIELPILQFRDNFKSRSRDLFFKIFITNSNEIEAAVNRKLPDQIKIG